MEKSNSLYSDVLLRDSVCLRSKVLKMSGVQRDEYVIMVVNQDNQLGIAEIIL
jgi:hypothetical protein